MNSRLVSAEQRDEIERRRADEQRKTVRFLKSVLLFALVFPLVSSVLGFLAQRMMLAIGMRVTNPLIDASLVEVLQLILWSYVFLFTPAALCGILATWNETSRTRFYYLYLALLGVLAGSFLPIQFLDLKDMAPSEIFVGNAVALVSAIVCWFAMKTWRANSELSRG